MTNCQYCHGESDCAQCVAEKRDPDACQRCTEPNYCRRCQERVKAVPAKLKVTDEVRDRLLVTLTEAVRALYLAQFGPRQGMAILQNLDQAIAEMEGREDK